MLGGIAVKFSYKKVVEDAGFVLGALSYDSARFFSAVSLYSRPYRAIHNSCFSLIDESEIMRDSNWGTNVLIMKMDSREVMRTKYSCCFRKLLSFCAKVKERIALVVSNSCGSRPYKFAINQFADLTNEEFKVSHNGYKTGSHSKSLKDSLFRYANVTVVPSTMEWRKKGPVTGVKDQGQCAHNRKSGVSICEQELVDFDTSEDHGCNGGLMDDAFQFITGNHGLTTESNYPYEGVDATCNTKKESSRVAKITGYEDVPANIESALLKAVANQPISVAIDADGSDFQFYSSGVFTGEWNRARPWYHRGWVRND
ncbi:hypothetical protein RD792_005867 [Penstemon davidsonii]|uniref:Peptidase C1A papain C-terminal domain-containing protein n=1 Tax=Penstemon davidsonii TaxID=160366 RepID=A0ABR0DF64_9LAMI|nr:hypothetical protein RD792_005867 [Penstemon davidsonii]